MQPSEIEQNILQSLNDAQRQAVLHGDGPLLVLAGAGSGKTRVIVHRIAHLISVRGVKPWRILAVTFTNKAAGELRRRLYDLIGEPARQIWAHTFHAFCARFLRREAEAAGLDPAYVIFDTDDQRRLMRQLLKDLRLDKTSLKPASVLGNISYAKTHGLLPDSEFFHKSDDPAHKRMAQVYAAYQQRLRESAAVDFDDLLLLTVRLLEDNAEVREKWRERFEHVLIDEYQDTNNLQYLIAQYLSGEDGNICAVGDDDQSIYGWRGADVRNILEFDRDFENPVMVTLEENYRSTAHILDSAWEVVRENKDRHPKRLRTNAGEGIKPRVIVCGDEDEEARQVIQQIAELQAGENPPRSIAVLYRANWQSRLFEQGLTREGMLYKIVGATRFYDRREVRDIVAYLRLVANPGDEAAFQRVINVPKRGIGQGTVERLTVFARAEGLSLAKAIHRLDEIPGLTARAATKVREFAMLLQTLRKESANLDIGELIRLIIERTGYDAMLDEESDGQDRRDNLLELAAGAETFFEEFAGRPREEDDPANPLDAFLETVALMSDVDEDATAGTLEERPSMPVSLMTLHSAKGLEFDAVFVTGLEEMVFPHRNAVEEGGEDGLAEERRLMYVGMTRARRRLFLTYAETRRVAGELDYRPPSRFLRDISEDHVEVTRVADQGYGFATSGFASGRPKRTRVGANTSPSWPQPGEMVLHPEHGFGQVMFVRGFGDGRRAGVDFDNHPGDFLMIRVMDLEKP